MSAIVVIELTLSFFGIIGNDWLTRSSLVCCSNWNIGCGQPSKVPREEFVRVDMDYCTAFAKACKAKGVKHMSLLGAVGADKDSWMFYLATKGKVEQNFIALEFNRTSLFR